MRRLKLFILIFSIALAVPLGYLVLRTHQSLVREEEAELRYFAETLFNDMEEELALLVQREEKRPIDAYSVSAQNGGVAAAGRKALENPFSNAPYFMGYLQNNPDGSFLAVFPGNGDRARARESGFEALERVNDLFNQRRRDIPKLAARASPDLDILRQVPPPIPEPENKVQSVADKYLAKRNPKQQAKLGEGERRVEQLTVEQIKSMAKALEAEQLAALTQDHLPPPPPREYLSDLGDTVRGLERSRLEAFLLRSRQDGTPLGGGEEFASTFEGGGVLHAEVDPMQSMLINENYVYVFRRIVIARRIYRQGFVLDMRLFLQHLLRDYFSGQPMAKFTNLELRVEDNGREVVAVRAGAGLETPESSIQRSFARPYSFLEARLSWDRVPRSEGRTKLGWVVAILAVVVLAGLFAIYQSARMVVDLSERRSGFVSSVTHELKTPLTTIGMYVEMLEQGMARDPEKKRRYFGILRSETQRLSRLIENVLEFSKVERKQRNLHVTEGDLGAIVDEVLVLLDGKLRSEGFAVRVDIPDPVRALYDPELMIQVLLNLVENSVKFGKRANEKIITITARSSGKSAWIAVADKGPGIPRHALRKVFDDFYRVDNSLTRNTQGTGIGLALVRRFVEAMKGDVSASNNDGPGCTVKVRLPAALNETGEIV